MMTLYLLFTTAVTSVIVSAPPLPPLVLAQCPALVASSTAGEPMPLDPTAVAGADLATTIGLAREQIADARAVLDYERHRSDVRVLTHLDRTTDRFQHLQALYRSIILNELAIDLLACRLREADGPMGPR